MENDNVYPLHNAIAHDGTSTAMSLSTPSSLSCNAKHSGSCKSKRFLRAVHHGKVVLRDGQRNKNMNGIMII